jgi:sugar/nucleoside kinase (ribokinase family)
MHRMDQGRNAELIKLAKARGRTTTVDIFASTPDDMPAVAGVLPHTDYFMPSIEEAQALSGLTEREDVAKFFLDRGVRCCVLTLGSEGAYWHDAQGARFQVPAYRIDVKCTCGCGDAFNAGFATALIHGFDPETTVRFAQATSALNATGLGSQAGVRSFEHTLAFMRETPTR